LFEEWSDVNGTPTNGYYSFWGPVRGAVLYADRPLSIGVLPRPDSMLPVGNAYPVGWLDARGGAVAVFDVEVGGRRLPGRYVCVGRRFVEQSEWASKASQPRRSA
jgi:hypothetical protein